MGQDKALVSFNQQPMIRQVVSRVTSIADEVFITTNHPEDFTFLGLRLVADIFPGKGALGGLFTALSYANTPLVGVIACDMPFANSAVLNYARELVEKGGFAAAIPGTGSEKEPFHAVYHRDTCLPVIAEALRKGFMRVDSWWSGVQIRYIDEQEINVLDPSRMAFWNVNTPEDLQAAQSYIDQG